MIQNAAALCAAELILWLYLRLGQEPEKSFKDIIIRKKVTVQLAELLRKKNKKGY